ncbi:MAG: SIS domain-containing protein [candidate division NC10 bacterium]|nr:SIS domain-containing protein [candidate division NC10 bacterium]
MRDVAEAIFRESARLQLAFLEGHLDLVVRAAAAITEILRVGGKVLLFGNGGSAADAQHIAAELVNRFLLDRPALPAIALTTDSMAFTGGDGGKLAGLVEYAFVGPSRSTARIQEVHATLGHVLCQLVETELFGKP